MDDYISRKEHDEFVKRMEDEHKRINHRIEMLEQESRQVTDLALSVRELAISIKQMAEEQKQHSEKLEALESRDGEMWRKAVDFVITAVIGAVVGFVLGRIGIQ